MTKAWESDWVITSPTVPIMVAGGPATESGLPVAITTRIVVEVAQLRTLTGPRRHHTRSLRYLPVDAAREHIDEALHQRLLNTMIRLQATPRRSEFDQNV